MSEVRIDSLLCAVALPGSLQNCPLAWQSGVVRGLGFAARRAAHMVSCASQAGRGRAAGETSAATRARLGQRTRSLLLAAVACAACLFEQGSTQTAETFSVYTIAGNGTEGASNGLPSQSQFAFLDPVKSGVEPWIIGVTIMEDDQTAVLIDSYNHKIRRVDLRSQRTTCVVSTKRICRGGTADDGVGGSDLPLDAAAHAECELKPQQEQFRCACDSDLTARCNLPDSVRHDRAKQMSGIVGLRSTVYFSNSWNETSIPPGPDANAARIYKLDIKKAPPERPTPIMHSLPTPNMTFAPRGLAKGSTSAELIFTNFDGPISKINVFSGVVTYLAGPHHTGSELGYRDGKGAQVQFGVLQGIATENRLKFSYFVDSWLCNVRQLNLATLEVTTLVGPKNVALDGSQCAFSIDGTVSRVNDGDDF